MDPVQIVNAILPQVLEYLTKPSTKDKYRESTEMLWKKISEKIKDHGKSGIVIVNDILQNPNDEDNQAALRTEIKKILRQEPEFLTEVKSLLSTELDISNISQYYSALLICSDFILDSQTNTVTLIKIIDKTTIRSETTLKAWIYLSLKKMHGLHEVRISCLSPDGKEEDSLTREVYFDTNDKSQYLSPIDIVGETEDRTLVFRAYIDNHIIAELSLDVHS